MHSRQCDVEREHTDRLATLAAALLLTLLVGTAIKFDLWRVPEDDSAAIMLETGTTLPPLTAALQGD